MAEVEYGGIKVGGSKLLLVIPLIGTLGGGLWAGFEFYKDYMDMKEQIQNYVAPDLSEFDKNLAVLHEDMKIVKESFKVHHLILEADTKARKLLTKEQAEKLKSYETLSFEKPYLDILFAETGDLLNERLGRAVIRLASIWKYCWEEAGKPELP